MKEKRTPTVYPMPMTTPKQQSQTPVQTGDRGGRYVVDGDSKRWMTKRTTKDPKKGC